MLMFMSTCMRKSDFDICKEFTYLRRYMTVHLQDIFLTCSFQVNMQVHNVNIRKLVCISTSIHILNVSKKFANQHNYFTYQYKYVFVTQVTHAKPRSGLIVIYNASELSRSEADAVVLDTVHSCFVEIHSCDSCLTQFSRDSCSFQPKTTDSPPSTTHKVVSCLTRFKVHVSITFIVYCIISENISGKQLGYITSTGNSQRKELKIKRFCFKKHKM